MRQRRAALLAGTASLLILIPTTPTASAAVTAAIPSDFNGDGYADLAVGVPMEGIGEDFVYGAVNVLYGSPTGITARGDQLWSQGSPGVLGVNADGDSFGQALTSGDFDSDGYADLAVGVPGNASAHGAVNVLYGSSGGLTAAGDQHWSDRNVTGLFDGQAEFGWQLTSGDFDGDGYADLAIGALSGNEVAVLYGGPTGLTAARATILTGATFFGPELAAGRLGGDIYDDLVVATDECDPEVGCNQGRVTVFHGAPAGLPATSSEGWSQDSLGVPGSSEGGDQFGASLEIGDFDGDRFGDLAIGVPGEVIGAFDAGAVNILYGTTDGLAATRAQLWHLGSPGVPGRAIFQDGFGSALGAGNFGGDGADELAIGVPGTDEVFGGRVIVLVGSSVGLTASGSQAWTQNTPGVPGRGEDSDWFGSVLVAADYGRSGRDDLAIGNGGESVGSIFEAGAVTVLYGRASGLTARGAQMWTQGDPAVHGRAEDQDRFGFALTP